MKIISHELEWNMLNMMSHTLGVRRGFEPTTRARCEEVSDEKRGEECVGIVSLGAPVPQPSEASPGLE
jgi:hypothetical protein